MWAALEAVQMKEYITALPEGLDAPVSEGGGNLSVRLTATHLFVACYFFFPFLRWSLSPLLPLYAPIH